MAREPDFDIQNELLECLPHMRAFARFLVKDAEQADDLVQDATVRVLSASGQFEPGTNFKAWVFTILRNLHYNNLRKAGRTVDTNPQSGALDLISALAATQESSLEFRDFYRAFWQLDEDKREVLMLVGASGLSYEDASKICGCEVGTIKSRASRARVELKEKLREVKLEAAEPESAKSDSRIAELSGSGLDP